MFLEFHLVFYIFSIYIFIFSKFLSLNSKIHRILYLLLFESVRSWRILENAAEFLNPAHYNPFS
jgi:hypothetical protein